LAHHDNSDADEAAHDRAAADEVRPVRLPPLRRVSPWSWRLIAIVVLIVLLFAPVWLDPVTLDQLRGATPRPIPSQELESPRTAPRTLGSDSYFDVSTTIVRDEFSRSQTTGWGSAEVGGTYTVAGADSTLAVVDGSGHATATSVPKGVVLAGVAVHDVDMSFEFGVPSSSAEGVVIQCLLRGVSGASYRPTITLTAEGATVSIRAVDPGSNLLLTSPVDVIFEGAVPNEPLHVRAQAVGSDPTTVRVRMWPASQPEPVAWQVSVIDWTGSLQHDGFVGLGWFLDESAPADQVAITFDNLLALAGAEAHRQ
jgi:hypothetical protein